MKRILRIAVCQLNCQADTTHNLQQCTALLRRASAAHATIAFTPENTSRLQSLDLPFDVQKEAFVEHEHPIIHAYQALAAELKLTLAIGSIPCRSEAVEDKMTNRSLLITPDGEIAARYDKIHLFDAAISATDQYLESRRIVGGDKAVLCTLKDVKLGLTICYDLRFPMLYRALAMAGAEVIAVPSAFTRPTGKAHWHALLRARAIENGVFIVAAAQCGKHTGDRLTYGHSIVIGPFGEIVHEMSEEDVGVVVLDLDLDECQRAKQRIPSLNNQREFTLEHVKVPSH